MTEKQNVCNILQFIHSTIVNELLNLHINFLENSFLI